MVRKLCVQVGGHNVHILIRTFLKLASLPSPPLWKLLVLVLLKFMEATVWFASCCLHWSIPLFKGGHHLVVCWLFNWCHCQCPSLCLCVYLFFFWENNCVWDSTNLLILWVLKCVFLTNLLLFPWVLRYLLKRIIVYAIWLISHVSMGLKVFFFFLGEKVSCV